MTRLTTLLLSALLALPTACSGNTEMSPEELAAKIVTQMTEADIRLTNNRIKDAQEIYQWVLTQQPQHSDALRGLAQVRAEEKNYDEAIKLLGQAVTANPQNAHAHAVLGAVYEKQEQPGPAAAAYGEAFKLKTDEAKWGLQEGTNLNLAKKFSAAETVLLRTTDVDPQVRYAWSQLGDALAGQNKHNEALKAYMKSLALYASDKHAHAGAALVYEIKKDTRRAVDHWSEYVRQDCCSKYSKSFARPKLIEMQAQEEKELEDEIAANEQPDKEAG